jgi:SAM-dependent methyltransferase
LAAVDALGDGGSVLDVGCGGGAAGVALVPPAARLTGVDVSAAMLANFTASTARIGIPSNAVEGSWPEVAHRVDPADVVVCHHVVYNVSSLVPFLVATADHARRRVVIELSDRHPSSSLNPLWERFWGLSRPQQPSAQLFIDVVREIGFEAVVSRWERPVEKTTANPEEYVAFVRRRLCLPAGRDAEVAEALASNPAPAVQMVTVWWDTARSANQLQSVT